MSSSDSISPTSSGNRSTRFWNLLAATALILLSVWTLAADLAHEGHFLLQPSLSSLFLGVFVSFWMLASLVFAAFPKRFVVPVAILTTARLSFGWPLLVWTDLRTASLALDLLLLVLALAYLVYSGGARAIPARPWVRWQHSVAMGAVILLTSILSLPAGLLGIAKVVEDTSAGFVRLTPEGIDLTERIYEKDGRRVHLVGMAHIADSGFYDALNRRLAGPVEGQRLVLLEGVSDRERILPPAFASGKTYRAMADKLGLAEQALGFAVQSDGESADHPAKRWTQRGIVFRSADIDVSELEAGHRERLVALLEAIQTINLESLFTMPDDMTAAELEELIVEGLLKRRNERLMEVFAEEESAFVEIVIPWGAAHMPDLERRLLALGYREVGEHRRRGIDFWKRFR